MFSVVYFRACALLSKTYRKNWTSPHRSHQRRRCQSIFTHLLPALTVLAPSRRVSSRFGRKRVNGLPHHIARCTRNHTPSVVARQPSKIRGAASSSQRSPGLLRCNKNHARGDDTSILRQSHRAHPAPCGSGTHARARSRYIAITLSF